MICRVRTLRQCPFFVAWECIGALCCTGAQPKASGEGPELIGGVGGEETHSSGRLTEGYNVRSTAYGSEPRRFFNVPKEV